MREARDHHLHVAAERATGRPFFIARPLAEFRALHEFSQVELAAWLGCGPGRLPELALCRRPAPDGPGFRRDIQRISAHVGLSPDRLAQLLREVDAVHALRRSAPSSGAERGDGMLLAARDRIEDPAIAASETRSRDDEESAGS